jgi:hypothetical protein
MLEGDYPLLQYDIVSAKTILDVLHLEEGVKATPQQVAHVLREEGFQQVGRHTFGTDKHYIWVRGGVSAASAIQTAVLRSETNQKNLCMELIYG